MDYRGGLGELAVPLAHDATWTDAALSVRGAGKRRFEAVA